MNTRRVASALVLTGALSSSVEAKAQVIGAGGRPEITMPDEAGADTDPTVDRGIKALVRTLRRCLSLLRRELPARAHAEKVPDGRGESR